MQKNIIFYRIENVFHIKNGFHIKKRAFAGSITFCFNLKKSAAEKNHHLLMETYGEHALSEITCRNWFRLFRRFKTTIST